MLVQLHEDINFHYETMRALGTIPYYGADFSEVSEIMSKIKAGDFDSWYDEWYGLAQRLLSSVDGKEKTYSHESLRDVYFRVSHYIFVADFFLHGNKTDPRLPRAYELWRKYFDKGNELLAIPGKHVSISGDGFVMPAMIFRAADASEHTPRPTLIIGGGFESNMEETWHVFGVAALARGYNVIIYEGPGHRTLIQEGHGFVAEWEKAVTPIVDYILDNSKDLSFIDPKKLGLVGMSLGGYLAARAAAFEPRLAALMCIDGVWDFLACSLNIFPQGKAAFEKGDGKEFDRLFEENPASWSTNRRWFHDDLLYTFCADSAYQALKDVAEKMTLANGVAERIKMPAFIGDATDDLFFEGQAPQVAKAIGANATLKTFGPEGLGSQLHCQSGALKYMNQEMLEWFAGVIGH